MSFKEEIRKRNEEKKRGKHEETRKFLVNVKEE